MEQRDLLFREPPHFLAVRRNHAEQSAILSQSNAHHRTRLTQFDECTSGLIFSAIGRKWRNIRNVDDLVAVSDLPQHCPGERACDRISQEVCIGLRDTIRRNGAEDLAIEHPHQAEVELAQADRPFEHRVEHRPEIAGRGVNDPQDLGGRGLLIERLACLGDEPRIFHRDHRLGGEIFEQSDLFIRERPNFLAVDGNKPEN